MSIDHLELSPQNSYLWFLRSQRNAYVNRFSSLSRLYLN